jgi:hypothetical protein
MTMQFTWADSAPQPVPDGMHYATFKSVEAVPEREFDGKKVPGVRWQFEIANGPNKGRTASRITGVSPTDKSMCGKIIAGLLSRTPRPGEACDIGQCVGKTYAIVVTKGVVESVGQPPQQ